MGGVLGVAGIEGFLENRDELKEVAADEDGPIKSFVQLMYDAFGSQPVPLSRPEGDGIQGGAKSLLDLYRIHAPELDLGFNDKRQETWPGLLGRAINKCRTGFSRLRPQREVPCALSSRQTVTPEGRSSGSRWWLPQRQNPSIWPFLCRHVGYVGNLSPDESL
jgi:hypothetical protein